MCWPWQFIRLAASLAIPETLFQPVNYDWQSIGALVVVIAVGLIFARRLVTRRGGGCGGGCGCPTEGGRKVIKKNQ